MRIGKTIKIVLTAFLSCLFLWGIFLCGKKIKQRWIIEKTIHSAHWENRNKEISKTLAGKYSIVFLGNSLTEMFDVQYYFNDTTLLNCGIVGDFSEGLLKRTNAFLKLKPKKIFIEIGINDIIEKIPLPEICRNYEKLLTIIRKESPETNIYIQSNLPVIINRPSLLTDNIDVNNLVTRQNKNLQELAKKHHCIYVDIYSSMIKEKKLETLFIWDGVHLTPKAYSIWRDVVKPYLSSDK
jgi:lysophospholipase L1-like esterase